jgi:hypothetical protein
MSEAGENAVGMRLRTVCHTCRTIREVIEQVGPHEFNTHSMVIPGDGTVYHRVRAVFEPADAVVEAPCPGCSDSGDPGWLTGFAMPA